MDVIGVIPARLGSTRLERKPLQTLQNKPIILWVCEAVKKCQSLSDFYVATDSEEIFEVVENAGFKAIMTPEDCVSGTDRVWNAVKDLNPKVIVNIQGDEPLIHPESIDALAKFMAGRNEECWATLGCSLAEDEIENKNAVKVVFDSYGRALYFSRWPIPFSRTAADVNHPRVLKHIGLYAYTYQALKDFCEASPSSLESAESLEQLRALDLGYKIYVLPSSYPAHGVDTIEDLQKLERLLGGL